MTTCVYRIAYIVLRIKSHTKYDIRTTKYEVYQYA